MIRELLGSPPGERYRLEALATYRTGSPLRRLLLFARSLGALIRWCLGSGPRIVHVHAAVRGSWYRKGLCVVVAKALRRRVVLHVHAGARDIEAFDARIGPLRRLFFRAAFGLADRVLSVSAATGRELERRFGATGVLVVPNAAPRLLRPAPAPQRAGPDPRELSVVYLGGFEDPAKGGHVLVKAAPAILAAARGIRIELAGPGQPPAAALELVRGSDRVRWLGWVAGERKAELLGRCDVFVLPSISEGLPVALLEAMAYGRAIVASRVGGVPEVLEDGVDALLVPPEDPAALAGAVIGMASDPALRSSLGSAARARAQRLNEVEVSGRLESLYRELAVA